MSDLQLDTVVIAGGGTAGWMAAASLARFLRDKPTRVVLIESSDIGTVGVGEATLPGLHDFNFSLGIDERDFIRATQASFKLGVEFRNWRNLNTRFFHPFSDYGINLNGIGFHHYLERLRQAGYTNNPLTDLPGYSFCNVLASHQKFAQPNPDSPSSLADFSYAYHFDATLYAHFLREYALKHGVIRYDNKIVGVNLNPDNGFIDSLHLDSGEQLKGDFFIDCSGFRALLIEGALKTGYEDWSHWLPCNRALAVQCENVTDPSPFTYSTAQLAGWQWKIQLQHRNGNGHVYCSEFINDDQANDILLGGVEGTLRSTPRLIKFMTGRRKQTWNKNCFALGLASGFMEPLESTSISLIQTGITKLLEFFPDKRFNPADKAEVNRLSVMEVERIRDFIILHYKSTSRDDTEFWRYCRNMPIPDSLQHKIAMFESRGHLVTYQPEAFEPSSWLTLFDQFGRRAARYDPRADVIPEAELIRQLTAMRSAIQRAVDHAMTQGDFIRRHCAAEPVAMA